MRPGLWGCADERRGRAARRAAPLRRWSGSSPDSTSLYLQAMDAMHQARAPICLGVRRAHAQDSALRSPQVHSTLHRLRSRCHDAPVTGALDAQDAKTT